MGKMKFNALGNRDVEQLILDALSNIIFLLFFNMPAGHETIIDAFDF
jgi:hypothetical protein